MKLLLTFTGLGIRLWGDLGEYSHCTDFLMSAGIQENEQIIGILTIIFFNQPPEKGTQTATPNQVEIW